MAKVLLKHIALLLTAIVSSVTFSVLIVEMIVPARRPGFIPREIAVGIYAAWIAGGLYLVFASILALNRRRLGMEAPMDVASPACFAAFVVVILLALAVASAARSNPTLL